MEYRAYGLELASEWPLPAGVSPRSDPTVSIDVTISRGVAEGAPRDPHQGCFRFAGEIHQFSWPLLGAVEIRGGRQVIVEPAPLVPEGLVAHVLLGPVLADILTTRGSLPLHASAVRLGERVVAFVGPTGSGKSSLAAALCQHHGTPHADDVVAVDPESGLSPFGAAFSKLSPAVLAALGRSSDELPVVYAGIEKRRLVLEGAVREAAPLAAVYRLEDGAGVEFTRVAAAEAVFRLLLDVFRVEIEQHAVGARALLTRCAQIAERVPLFTLRRPRELARLGELAAAVAHHAAQL